MTLSLFRRKPLTGIAPLWNAWSLWWHRRALRELVSKDPMHADVNHLVLAIREIEGAK